MKNNKKDEKYATGGHVHVQTLCGLIANMDLLVFNTSLLEDCSLFIKFHIFFISFLLLEYLLVCEWSMNSPWGKNDIEGDASK